MRLTKLKLVLVLLLALVIECRAVSDVNVVGPAIGSSTSSSYTATTTSGTALALNGLRKDATIVNTGTVWVYLSRGGTAAVAGSGIGLAPNGGFYNIEMTNLYRGPIQAISASATAVLAIVEGQ